VPKSVFTDRYRRLLRALVDARQSQGLTQAQLGRRLGQDQTFVSKFERGVRRLDVVEFLDVTEALGVDPLGLLIDLKRKRRER
jgi:transcriptional regulator with XRE-family HTH domain